MLNFTAPAAAPAAAPTAAPAAAPTAAPAAALPTTHAVHGGFTLESRSNVGTALIDQTVLDEILIYGELRALQNAAQKHATAGDTLFRTVLHVGTLRGVFRLSPDDGKYPSKDEAIQAMLVAIADDGRNSTRKYVGEILRAGWNAQAMGKTIMDAPSMAALRLMASKTKAQTVQLDADGISRSEKERVDREAMHAAEQAERDQAERDRTHALLLEARTNEREIVMEEHEKLANEQALAHANELAKLKADIVCALYGTQKDRTTLKTYYKKAA